MLPTFDNPETPNKRVDLRRLLLNKCQVEFEKGIEADSKVKAREEQETNGAPAVREGSSGCAKLCLQFEASNNLTRIRHKFNIQVLAVSKWLRQS